MKISTGESESHPTPLPIDASATPAVAPPTRVFPSGNQQGGVLGDISGVDFTGESAAAMAAGMSADSDRRGRYAAAMEPIGSGTGDLMNLSQPPTGPGVGLSDVDLPVDGLGY